MSIVSMGNPHAVRLVKDVATDLVGAVGSALQEMPVFEHQVNAGFMQVISRKEVNLRVYERGAGETLACGSGACAAVSQAFAAAFWTTMCLFTCAAVTFAFAGADRPKTRSTCRVRP